MTGPGSQWRLVSEVGIDHGKAKPKAEAVWLIPPGDP